MTRRCHASGEILQSPKLERHALPFVGLRPKIRTSSFAVSHTHLAASLGVLVWQSDVDVADRISVESGLDSHLRWRSRKGPELEKTSSWHATLSRIRKVSSVGVAEKIGSTPLCRTAVHTRGDLPRGASTLP